MAKRDAKIARLSQVPMFSACSKKDLETVARLADELTIDEGQEIIHEGETGREFYIVMDGKATVKRGGRDVGTLGAGDYFGELALLDGQKRDATVTATAPTEVLVIGVREFVTLLEDVPQLTRKLLGGMARRLHELDGANR
jgi:CRP/FNR family cyclic AMP-dependent transcriptional regulator